MKRTGIRRATPLKTGRKQHATEKQCRRLLPIRSGGVCEVQIPGVCTSTAQVPSHRKRRSQSSKAEIWSPTNVLHNCLPCELHLTEFGATSRVRSFGWTVHPTVAPAAVPVLRRDVWVWLTPSGDVVPLEFKELEEWVA